MNTAANSDSDSRRHLATLAVACALLFNSICHAASREQQREWFVEAESALKSGDSTRFEALKDKLTDYPLFPYLEYWQLRRKLSRVSEEQMTSFLQRYDDQPVGWRLRSAWLHRLGQRKDWDAYLRYYTPQGSVTLQCYYVRARLARDGQQQALQDALDLWMVGHSQPDECDPAFARLYDSGLITPEHLWKRIRLAFAEQKPSLAVYLSRRLPAADRTWVERWKYAHTRPTAAMKKSWAKQDKPVVREILTHATRRLARHKPEQAWKHWQELTEIHDFSLEQQASAIHQIALYGALRNHPQASTWLAAVPEGVASKTISHWRVRNALTGERWEEALRWIDALKPSERNDDMWRYWQAYALEASGQQAQAEAVYTKLSNSRSYYGFLAADRLKRPYHMNHDRLDYPEEKLEAVRQLPGIMRAREMYLIGKQLEARREWYYATVALPRDRQKLAALIAHDWGWHDRAILTATRARYWSDLMLRFPLPHRESVFHYAEQRNLDPALIYGVIRQESAFMEDARSPVGALGLMQLMPDTGKRTAQALKLPYTGKSALLKSDLNIRLGSAYLGKQLERYGGSPVLAAAAYNAGPHRVRRWLPKDKNEPAALWIERIPFNETRRYVRRVLAYATVFEWRLDQPQTRISERMPEVRTEY